MQNNALCRAEAMVRGKKVHRYHKSMLAQLRGYAKAPFMDRLDC